MYQVLLTNYGCSMSSGHAAHTQNTDYVAVLQEVAGLLDHAECHAWSSPLFIAISLPVHMAQNLQHVLF